jgi:HAD superfamily hydrolase (TIGR01509 family)
MVHRAIHIRAVLFDLDGTLTDPDALDWGLFRERIGCPQGTGVLEFIDRIEDSKRRRQLISDLTAFEAEGAARSRPAHGVRPMVEELRRRNIPMGILTRNSRRSVETALTHFEGLGPDDFDPIITRESGVAPKPDPQGVYQAARRWGISTEEVLVVGDFVFDVEAGLRAGAVTALLAPEDASVQPAVSPDFKISRLSQVVDIVRLGTPISGGKLPNDLLEPALSAFAIRDADLVVAPGVGQDTAAVSIGGNDLLVLKSDPITFVTDAIAEYAVVVNANDIATSGAVPRWMLTTLLFPPGTTPLQIRRLMEELNQACGRRGITLCGGHTEITDAVTRPVVTGMLCGIVQKNRLIDKRNMAAGDRIVMTKAVSVEGTAIIAREFSDRLLEAGISASTVKAAADFLSQLSILEEARIAATTDGVSAMHDVTEGGLATAVTELAAAGGCRLRIRTDRIPVFAETEEICGAVDIDPMGLIGSGSLLITCRADRTESLIGEIRNAGIAAADIGKVMGPGNGVAAYLGRSLVPWPAFEADELTRLF